MQTVAFTGGHLASNLGAVELTVALHYVLNMPKDKIIWDVGHQAYAHKLITGRRDRFHTLRQYQGISGFPKVSESEYDAFETGHSSTSISAALGMALAKDLKDDPAKTIAVCLYVTYPSFRSMPKPGGYRGIFVMRDPRDVAVSWYYSTKFSHPEVAEAVTRRRRKLQELSKEDGLLYMIDHLSKERGMFDCQRTWAEHLLSDGNMRVFRYEDLFGDHQQEAMRRLFDHLGIPLGDKELAAMLAKYSFARLSGGRKKGRSDKRHHYRRGEAGSWQDELTPRVLEAFAAKTGDLLAVLGYASA